MRPIPVHLLNAFTVFNDSANITEAAAKLQITQPALSKQLKQLEVLVPQALFTVSGRKKVLTPFGRDLNRRLSEKLGNIQETVNTSRLLHADSSAITVRIVGRRGVLDRFSGKLKFPGSVQFSESSNDDSVQSLLALRAEIGIVHRLPDHYELLAKPLFKEEFQLVIPKTLLSKKPTLGANLFAELKNLPCLGYRPDDEVIQQTCGYSPPDMKNLKMLRTSESYVSLQEMLEARLGWSVIPNYLKASEVKHWVLPVPPKSLPLRQFYLIYRKEFASLPWFKALLSEIRHCFESH